MAESTREQAVRRGFLRRSKYVKVPHLQLRSRLPDHHPESWPSQYEAVFGTPIPDDWKRRLSEAKKEEG